MVVLLVFMTFLVFISIELVQERRREARAVREQTRLRAARERATGRMVAGFDLPEPLHYHRGHTWFHWVEPDGGVVGTDDFARRLLGTPTRIKLPAVGTHLHQGDKVVEVEHGGVRSHLVAPVEGEVVAVNPELARDPGLLHRDPYGSGWLYRVRSKGLFQNIKNLLNGSLAERWMEDTWGSFQHRLMLASGSVIQDGGSLVDDIGDHLDPDVRRALVDEFLTIEPTSDSGR